LSHRFPILGDFFYDLQANFNVLTDYPATPSDSSDYKNLEEIFQKVLDKVIELNDLITGCIEICHQEGDYNIKASLSTFLATRYVKYINQAIILRDKAHLYGDNVLDFDRDIKKFFILED
jgi:ferritin